MKKFHLEKDNEKLAEGVIFSNGSVALSWMRDRPGGSFYTDLFEIERIHRDFKVVLDNEDTEYESLSRRSIFEVGRADNGWVVREYDSDSVTVASENHESSEHKAFVNLLYSILSQHGPSDSKYSSERILVTIIPGSDSENGNLEPSFAREQVLDHIDYSLRFLRNINPKNKTEDLVILENQIDLIFESLFSKVFGS